MKEKSVGERSYVSVQSESQSNVLALMATLMFYHNQRYIRAFGMLFNVPRRSQAEQYSAHTAQRDTAHAVHTQCSMRFIRMFDSRATLRKPKAISRGQIPDCCSQLNYLPYIPTICKVPKPSQSKSACNTAQ